MRLNEIKRWLTDRDLRLTKSLGQNFLHDGNQLRRIIAKADLSSGDRVLEIGPGLGPLTEALLENGAKVLAIEKDLRLCEVLRERLPARPGFELVEGDALDWLRNADRDWRGWKLVANLPYSVASPILVDLALASSGPDLMVVTLQLEVAQRLLASAGTEHYGLLSLLIQLGYEGEGWFRIPAGCFFPEPDIDSACVVLRRRQQPMLDAERVPAFRRLVKCGFGQRRKQLLKLLKAEWPEARLIPAWRNLDLPPEVRAEAVTLSQFVELVKWLSEERFDVVDQDDQVIGQQPRREVHALGLRHRAVHLLVFNQNGEVFLQKRSMTKDCFPGTWDSSASGHLEVGEAYDQAATRELREELGLDLDAPLEPLFKLGACAETGQEFVWVYRGRAEGPFDLHPEEIERGEWHSVPGVDRWVTERPDEFASGFRLVWRQCRERKLV